MGIGDSKEEYLRNDPRFDYGNEESANDPLPVGKQESSDCEEDKVDVSASEENSRKAILTEMTKRVLREKEARKKITKVGFESSSL